MSVSLPSTLKVIGKEAFEGCKRLNEIHTYDAIETIETEAFNDCNFTNFRIPPSISSVNVSILDGNYSLVSLELSEYGINRIAIGEGNVHSDTVLGALRNIALPSYSVVDINRLHRKDCHHWQ